MRTAQAIEALDPRHQCLEYWSSKENQRLNTGTGSGSERPFPPHGIPVKTHRVFGMDLTKCEKDESNLETGASVEEVQHVLGGLFKKANPHELRMMHQVLCSESWSTNWRAAFRTLLDEIQKNCI